jgi:hypothetical protein
MDALFLIETKGLIGQASSAKLAPSTLDFAGLLKI